MRSIFQIFSPRLMAEETEQSQITDFFRQEKGFTPSVSQHIVKRESVETLPKSTQFTENLSEISSQCETPQSSSIFEKDPFETDMLEADILAMHGDFSYPSICRHETRFSGPTCIDFGGQVGMKIYSGPCVLSLSGNFIPCPSVCVMCTVKINGMITYKGPCVYDEVHGMIPVNFHICSSRKLELISIEDDLFTKVSSS